MLISSRDLSTPLRCMGGVRSRGVHRDTAGCITWRLYRYIHRAIGFLSRKGFGDRRLHEPLVPHNTDSTHPLALALGDEVGDEATQSNDQRGWWRDRH